MLNQVKTHPRTAAASTLAIFAAVIAAALFATGAVGRTNRTYAFVAADVPPGLVLHRSANAVEKQVLDQLGNNSRIINIRAVAARDDVRNYVPIGTEAGSAKIHGGPAWIVHATGMFQRVTDPPGSAPLATPREGFVVVDDATGETLAYGWGPPPAG